MKWAAFLGSSGTEKGSSFHGTLCVQRLKMCIRDRLVVLLAVSGTAAFAEGEDIVLTYGKEFDFDGKTFLEGQDLENNYYLDYAYEKHGVKVCLLYTSRCV